MSEQCSFFSFFFFLGSLQAPASMESRHWPVHTMALYCTQLHILDAVWLGFLRLIGWYLNDCVHLHPLDILQCVFSFTKSLFWFKITHFVIFQQKIETVLTSHLPWVADYIFSFWSVWLKESVMKQVSLLRSSCCCFSFHAVAVRSTVVVVFPARRLFEWCGRGRCLNKHTPAAVRQQTDSAAHPPVWEPQELGAHLE